MSQSQDLEAIANYIAGARGTLRDKLAKKVIDVDQARRAESIGMDFANWYRNLGWFDRNANDAVLSDAKARRNAFNAAVSPHAYAWVQATAMDIPDEKREYAIAPKTGDVVHKKTGTVIKKNAKSLPTDKPGKPGKPSVAPGATPASQPAVIVTRPTGDIPPSPSDLPAPKPATPVAPAAKKLSPIAVTAGVGVAGAAAGAALGGPVGALIGALAGALGGNIYANKKPA